MLRRTARSTLLRIIDLRVTDVVLTGADVRVTFTTMSNKVHRVERRDDLTSSTWTTVTNNVLGTGAPTRAIDAGAAGQPRRFYRVRL